MGEGSTAPAADPTATGSATADATASDATPAVTAPAPTVTAATTATGGGSSLFDYLQQVLDAIGTSTTSGSVTFSAKAKLELLASAVGAASITPQETTAADVLKGVVAATTGGGATGATGATGAASA